MKTEQAVALADNQDTYTGDITSIVSYPHRCSLWGDANYRGNCDGRLFAELLGRYRPRSVADPMEGSGTIRDVVNWWNKHKDARIRYWGGDLRGHFDLITQGIPGTFDLVWIHPPYWNIIQYSHDIRDLSNMPTYLMFRQALRICLTRCYAALASNGRLAVLVGDVRKQGLYLPIVRDVLNLEGDVGQLRSIIIKVQHHCHSNRTEYNKIEDPRIQHEYCVVFKKAVPNQSNATVA